MKVDWKGYIKLIVTLDFCSDETLQVLNGFSASEFYLEKQEDQDIFILLVCGCTDVYASNNKDFLKGAWKTPCG